jgi:multidrug efflux pump subunit AcrB
MNVSTWSIKNPIPALMLFVLLCFGGLLSFNAMKVQNFPDIDLPTISVTVALPGAAPAQLENDVARKIENSIATLQGLKHIYTKIQDGGATVTAEFRLEKPTQEALDDVRSAVARVRGDLPGDVRDPIVTKMDLAAQPVLAFTIASSRMDDEALSWFVDNDVAKKLLTVRGVGAVNRVGGVERQVHVALDPLKLQALGTTAADISRQLRQVQQESAGGRTDLGGSEQPVRTLATVQTAQELAGLSLALPDGRAVRLDQLATVRDTVAEPRALALLDGQPVVGFEVARSKGASEVEVGAAVQAALAELRAQHPGLEITEAFNFVAPVQEEYDGSMHLLYEGALLACWWCGCSCAMRAPPSSRPWRCRCRSFRRSSACICWAFPSTSSRCWRCRWWWASWWTTRSWRWRTSCATCAWARRPTRRPWRPPTRSAWR